MRLPISLVLLAACSDPVEPVWTAPPFTIEASADSTEPAEPGPRRSVVLTVSPLVPGGETTFTVTGLNPLESVTIARSLTGLGAGACFGTAGLLCLDIRNAQLHGSATADADGLATLVQTLPSGLSLGTNVSFQAVVPRGGSGASWDKSGAVAVVIEDAPLNQTNLLPGDLVITEIMRNPAAVTDTEGEWFEVRNNRGQDANLAGVEITDFGADSHIIDTNVFVPAFGAVVLGRQADSTLNGGVDVDYEYANVVLGNSVDELNLMAGPTIIDAVPWDAVSFPTVAGASMELNGEHLHDGADLDNDVGVNWSAGSVVFGAGDLATPGEEPPGIGRYLYRVNLGNSRVERVDLDNSFVVEDVGYLWADITSGSLAWDSRNQQMYMLGYDAVSSSYTTWTVDIHTGAATVLGVLGYNEYLRGLAYDRFSDRLLAGGFGSSTTDRGLWEIDRTTGLATKIGDPWSDTKDVNGLTADPKRGTLLAVLGDRDLVSIDLETLTSSVLMPNSIGSESGLAYDPTNGLVYAWDQSLGVVGSDLLELDPYGAGTSSWFLNDPDTFRGLVHVPWAP